MGGSAPLGTPASPAPTMNRLTALDGLRAIAVFAVVLQHYGPTSLANVVNPGGLGVRLFFVLSGFLITGILLAARRDAGPGGRGPLLRAFYMRRALRILPVFYLVLALGVILEPQIRRDWLWHAAHLSNHYVIALGHWPRAISHAWSLAVEEQFYLVWPLLMLFIPRPWLGRAIGATILVGPLSRGLMYAGTGSALFASLPMTSSLDSLGIGAWLAWRRRPDAPRAFTTPHWVGAVGLAAMALSRTTTIGEALAVTLGDVGAAAAFLWLIDSAARGVRGTVWLRAQPLVYVGTISYGVYLIHNLVGSLAVALAPRPWARWIESHGVGPALAVTAISVLLASLSWRLFEAPLNRLKRHWPYSRPHAASGPQTGRDTGPGAVLSA